MIRILPIILIVVLSGCTTEIEEANVLENCADSLYFSEEQDKFGSAVDSCEKKHGKWIEENPDGSLKEENGEVIFNKRTSSCIDEKAGKNRITDIKDMKNYSLSKKLKGVSSLTMDELFDEYSNIDGKRYTVFYQQCEMRQREFPKTFDATWQ